MADRTVSVDLVLRAQRYVAGAHEAKKATESLDRSVKEVDRDLDKLPADAAKAAAAMKTGARRSRTDLKGLGEESKQAERRYRSLADGIASVQREADKLAQTYRKGGGPQRARQIATEIAQLKLVQRELDGVGDEAKEAQRKVRALERELALLRLAGLAGGGQGMQHGGITGMLGPLSGLSPGALAGVGVGAAAAGAALAGPAVLGGAAVTGIAAGAALAAQNERVRKAYADLGKDVFADLKKSAEAEFVDPLVRSADIFSAAYARQRPVLEKIFKDSAELVQPLSRGLAGAAENFLPGFERALRGARPLIREMERDLPQIGRALGDMLEMISRAGPGAAATFRLITGAVEILASAVGTGVLVIGGLTDNLLKFDQATRGIFGPVANWGHLVGDTNAQVAAGNSELARMAERQFEAARAAAAHTRSLEELTARMNDMYDSIRSAQQLAVDWEAGLDAVTEAFKGQNDTLNITTELGRKHTQILLDQIDVADRQRKMQIAQGVSADVAGAAFNREIQVLFNLAKASGASDAELHALFDRWIAFGNAPAAITKHVTIEVEQEGRVPGTRLKFRAAGGPLAAGDTAVVGESGPELLQMRKGGGAMVTPLRYTAQRMNPAMPAGRPSGTSYVELVLTGGDASTAALLSVLRREIHSYGGDVQARLGTRTR